MNSSWEQPGGRKIAWHIHPRDPRWVPFHLLLKEVYERYRRPTFIAETSHVGVGRAPTEAVVRASLAILISNFFLSFALNVVFPTVS